MCVFVFRYLFYYYNMYDCEYVLYYFIALHVYEQITIVYSFQKIKKNILKIHYLKTFIRCIIMNALISNIQLKWILSWMAFFHVQVGSEKVNLSMSEPWVTHFEAKLEKCVQIVRSWFASIYDLVICTVGRDDLFIHCLLFF